MKEKLLFKYAKRGACVALATLMMASVTGCRKEEKTIKWPDSDVANILPVPSKLTGEIGLEQGDYLSVDLSDYSIEEFDEYVDKCKENGFTEDYYGYDGYYSAENSEGYSLILSYNEKDEELSIQISSPNRGNSVEEEPEETTKQKATKKSTQTTTTEAVKKETEAEDTNSESDTDFREMIDSYEAFMNEYVDFMKEYKNSDDTMGMLTEYTEIMAKYSDWVKKIGEVDQSSLSADDLAYFLEVTGRVTEKLASVQ